MRRILRTKADELLQREATKEEGEDKLLETRGVFLMESYNYYFKVFLSCFLMEYYNYY